MNDIIKAHRIEDLVFELPDCPVCDDGGDGGDMNCDCDAIWCETCGTSWNKRGENGQIECDICGEYTDRYVPDASDQLCAKCDAPATVSA